MHSLSSYSTRELFICEKLRISSNSLFAETRDITFRMIMEMSKKFASLDLIYLAGSLSIRNEKKKKRCLRFFTDNFRKTTKDRMIIF